LSISFLHSGLYTTIQDQGRSLGGRLGVPQSGAMDKTALNLANMIVGNGQSEAAIECTLIGPRIRFDQEVVICICGAVVQPFVDDQPIKMNTATTVKPGSVLHFGKIVSGTRYYIAIAGGIQSDEYLASRSTCITSGIGRLITNDSQFEIGESNYSDHGVTAVRQLGQRIIKGELGPEYEEMSRAINGLVDILRGPFTIQANSNRMAYRIQNISSLKHQLSILSSGVMPGTVQLTPSGDLIFLMRDAQTTGGYPRLLQIQEQSICDLAQLKAGDSFEIQIVR